MSEFSLDPELRKFASGRALEYFDKIDELGGVNATATFFGVSHGTVWNTMSRLKKSAATKGYSPAHDMTHTVPDPFIVRGTSTYYNKHNEKAGQWVKTKIDDQRYFELMTEAAAALAENVPRALPLLCPELGHVAKTLTNLFVLTDVHLGMLAWEEEGGANWDIKIAETTVERVFQAMVTGAPQADNAVIAQLGDWLHFDGLKPITTNSGHVLDSDTRFAKVIRAAVRLLRRVVDHALLTHKTVTLLLAEGNYDEASSQWMQTLFEALYENDPRITVVVSAKPYYAIPFGKTALFFHHGHKRSKAPLALLLAAEFRKIWGNAEKAYCHTGHKHSELVEELPGIKMIQHPTLAARDSHASRSGWISERQAMRITYHSEFGDVGSAIVTPAMVGC